MVLPILEVGVTVHGVLFMILFTGYCSHTEGQQLTGI
ncbi:hypothetical protein SLEP1_g25708 [Rubroshorea leprosula]|uniref:Uncharacterized protein n=1 Tax=Rubroshorea leprosula TaxID=152421 RepID=A0AAV5JXC0_9ROSI|nr:hypothetical protein SLEP1_g25708 [Rubroshorea leprosula]